MMSGNLTEKNLHSFGIPGMVAHVMSQSLISEPLVVKLQDGQKFSIIDL